MTRRKLREEELFAAAEELLLEKGYGGFHFKELSERLNIGRSTLYEYYPNKEELICSYMLKVMQQIFDECNSLSSNTPLQELKDILYVFMKRSQIHKIIQIIPMINQDVSPAVERGIQRLFEYHHQLYARVMRLVDEAKEQGEIRDDIPSIIIARIFFTAIQIPSSQKSDPRFWSELIFQILYEGLGEKKSC